MPNYHLQIRQVVDYPRCRVYRQFIQALIADRSIRTDGGSGLFYYTVLCSYVNFRTSYHRIGGISYTVYPGEWVCTLKELSAWLRTRFQWQTLEILNDLQKRRLISWSKTGHGRVIRYRILHWDRHNTVLDYNCPCQKDTGFFFIPMQTVAELIGSGRCCEMDAVLDLWTSTVYRDEQVQGSDAGPVVYLRNGTGSPLINSSALGRRWGVSKSTAWRILKKLEGLGYLSLLTFPGRKGSVIYLQNYLSTMFQISDVLIDKEEIAMALHIPPTVEPQNKSDMDSPQHKARTMGGLPSVSIHVIRAALQKLEKILISQGVACAQCPRSSYKLYSLPNDCKEINSLYPEKEPMIRFGVLILCGSRPLYRFELTLLPEKSSIHGGKRHE